MKKYSLIVLAISVMGFFFISASKAKDYSSLWKQVEQKESDDLPKSAIEIVDQILDKSISEKNIQQAIKATIYKTRYQSEIDKNKQIEIFVGLEKLINISKNETDKSLLHSLLAELYIDYYNTNAYRINERTDIEGTIPENIEEWTKNIFFDKAIEHLKASVKNENFLLKIKVDNYKDIIDIADDTQSIYPTMYDFLMNRAISVSEKMNQNISVFYVTQDLANHHITIADLALPIDQFVQLDFPNDQNLATLYYYSQFLKNLQNRNRSEAILFTELNKNQFLSQYIPNYNVNYSLSFLQNLSEKYAGSDIDVEVIAAIVDQLGSGFDYLYINRNYVQDTAKIQNRYELLEQGINKYPNYKRINVLKEKLATLTLPQTSIEGKDVFYPTNEKQFILDYRNISAVEVSVINDNTQNLVWSKKIKLSPATSYLNYKTSFDIDLTEVGAYKMYIKSTDFDNVSKTDSLIFRISRIASFSRVLDESTLEFYMVDRKTGTPIFDATVFLYSLDYKSGQSIYTKLKSAETDKQGLVSISLKDLKDKGSLYYTVKKGSDISDYDYCRRPYFYSNTSTSQSQKNRISLFTDRSLYRPGQPVYFKAIVNGYDNNKQPIPIVGKNSKVVFYNTNRQIISETTLTTNDFGSIAGSFIIPKGGLNGAYIINVDGTEAYISVEEYKRPTFEVVFDKINKTYTYGDSVKITGYAQNFSGIKLENVTINYDVEKSPLFRWWGNNTSIDITDGMVETNKDGVFEITFKIPEKESSSGISPLSFYSNLFNFNITATATDLNGETQSGSTNLVVGDVSMILSANVPDKIEHNAKSEIKITAQNLDGQAIETKGNYTIYSVLSNDSIDKEVGQGQFDTQNISELNNNIEKLSSGKYLLELKAKDDQGRPVEAKNYFIVYSMDDKRPPVETNEWLIDKNATFDESKPAEIIIGVSSKNVTILYDLMKDGKLINREQFVLSDENKKISIPYKKEYRDNVTTLFTYVIDEVVYQKQVDVKKVSEQKELVLKWNVFRDKVRPGQKESWSIVVKDTKGNPAYAELLASMYDASLVKIQQTQDWYLSVALLNYTYTQPWSASNSYSSANVVSNFALKSYEVKALQWNRFNWFNFSFEGNFNYAFPVMRSVAAVNAPVAMEEKSLEADYNTAEKPALLKQSALSGGISEQKITETTNTPQIRKNFDETAFFYPQLKTNSKGETVISFTVPESNTTWKFRALAYDKKFDIGKLDATIVSQKELMVTPNIPRFMRQGDKTSISTKISNLSEKTISGKVRIEFFNPLTDEVNTDIKIENQYQNFNLISGASSDASWLFDVPEGIDVLGCRIVAESESFSDGEQHAIPVLPNKMMVTESMTMNMNGSGSKDFVFDRFVNNKSQSITNYRLTLEYANNPAWYAVQALPTISNPTNENAINWFASYYANTLSQSIGQQYPKVTAAINSWKSKGGDRNSFVSQLQKNEDLKTVLLEETPWVLQAKNETEQMQKLSLLFDLNNTSMQATTAISKLQDLQREDGGWAWFNGMNSNKGVTLYLLYGFSELTNLNAVEYTSDIKEMQIKALKYLDNDLIASYNSLKTNNKDWKIIKSIPTSILEYMYVRSSYRDIPISQEAREAERFYTSVVENNWQDLTYYQKSLLVVLAKRNGNNDLTNKLISSLREHATVNEEMGMYWANNTSSAFISQSAVTVHTFIMEAFKEAGADLKEMDLMKQWLLKQKQTQSWESTHATIDAIYALLSTGSNWFSTDSNAKIYVGKKLVEEKPEDNVIGYVQQSWNKDEITSNMGNIRIERTESSPAWGVMYWQYFEDLNKITNDNNRELNINKKYFIEENQSLQPITPVNMPKVGDKVTVRLTVRTDRDFDFIQIKDMRPSCFEPVSATSGYKFMNGVGYYQSTKDASTNFFFDVLPKGTYVFEYSVYVNRSGIYSAGITTIQCMYAPQFVSHTSGETLSVK